MASWHNTVDILYRLVENTTLNGPKWLIFIKNLILARKLLLSLCKQFLVFKNNLRYLLSS